MIIDDLIKSPSMRREWIEIIASSAVISFPSSLPPCGGSGLKFLFLVLVSTLRIVSLHAEGVD